jgi:hypothetical protein
MVIMVSLNFANHIGNVIFIPAQKEPRYSENLGCDRDNKLELKALPSLCIHLNGGGSNILHIFTLSGDFYQAEVSESDNEASRIFIDSYAHSTRPV